MQFSIGEIVKAIESSDERLGGVVKHITCFNATGSGGKSCDRNNCRHIPRNHVWVKWPNGKLCSYNVNELEVDKFGEDEVLDIMSDAMKSSDKEVAQNAEAVVKTIVKARAARKSSAAISAKKITTSKSPTFSSATEAVSRPSSVMGIVKSDAANAAYRVASKQINTGVRNAIVEMLKKQGASNAHVEAMAGFLATEWGASLISVMAGYGLGYVPMIKDNPKAQRLAKEFRVAGMANAGNEAVTAMMAQFLPVITNALASLPEEASYQVPEGSKSTEEKEDEIEIDTSDLESHLEEEEKKDMVNNGT